MDIKLITLSNYVRPKVVENKSRGYVLNGHHNSFYQYIIDRNNGSPTNSSINKTYNSLIYGGGLTYKNGIYGVNDWAKLQTVLRPNDVRKMVADFQVFGEFACQVIQTKGGDISSIKHIPKQMVVPSICNEDYEIDSYWYSRNWRKINQNPPEQFPAFGYDANAPISIYVGSPYTVGDVYFATPDYLAGMPYCEFEEELANLNINSIKNGLSAGYIINVPNGKSLTPQEKDDFERQVRNRLTRTPNASQFILSFNGADVEITVTPLPQNSAIHKQWDWLSGEAKNQIMTSHRVISPSIIGLSTSSGFSSVAEEMDMAERQMVKRVIQPKKDFITESFEHIISQFGMNLDLMFKPLTEDELEDSSEENNTGIGLKKKDGIAEFIAMGDESLDGYVPIDVRRCEEITLTEGVLDDYLLEMSRPPKATPEKRSKQDTSLFQVRYRYAGAPSQSNQREFCTQVLNANRFYRAEDLNKKSTANSEFAPKGSNSYNIFLYKGGVNCKHYWERVIFLKEDNQRISVNKAVKMILELEPSERADAKWQTNPKQVAQIGEQQNNYWSLTPNYRDSGVTPQRMAKDVEVEFESYNDYPESAKNNAQKVLDWREKYGSEVKGMTRVGWVRANQLAKGRNISRSTIARMSAFQRHKKNSEVSAENKSTPWKDKGYVAWLGWGGTSGINWASKKLKQIDKK